MLLFLQHNYTSLSNFVVVSESQLTINSMLVKTKTIKLKMGASEHQRIVLFKNEGIILLEHLQF